MKLQLKACCAAVHKETAVNQPLRRKYQRKMLRVCITSPNPLEVKVVNGKKVFYMDSFFDEIFSFLDIFHANKSYYAFVDPNVCLNLMKLNESDISTDYFSLGSHMDYFRVPVPFFEDRTSILTGYDTKGVKSVDKSSALGNFQLLEAPVYIGALFLTVLFILAIAARSFLRHQHELGLMKLEAAEAANGYLYAMKMLKIRQASTAAHIKGKIYREVYESLFGSSDTYPYITLLFVILLFYLFASFNALFKTSCIEFEDPHLIKSYEQLIDHAHALPMFYDIFQKVSDAFEFAPEDSLRGRVWSKLVKSGADMMYHVFGREGRVLGDADEVQRYFELMNTKRYVSILSSRVIAAVRPVMCVLSPDGTFDEPEQLRHMETFTDPIEPGKLGGWPIALYLMSDRHLMRGLTLLFQSHLMPKLNDGWEGLTMNYLASLLGTDRKHLRRQQHVCGDSYRPDFDDTLKPMTLKYFQTMFTGLILIYSIAIVINRVECLLMSPQHQRTNRKPCGNITIG